jgi:outer membrane protein TolC
MPARGILLSAVLLLSTLCGCRQAYVSPGDTLGPAAHFRVADEVSERCPEPAAAPVSTVATAERPPRPVSLAECISLALENGRTGEFYDRIGTDRQTSVSGLQRQASPSAFSDNVRVFAYDPAIANTFTVQSLARFDALWRTTAAWNHVENPDGIDATNSPLVGVLGNGLTDTGQFRTDVLKPLPSGGVAGIGFRTDYTRAVFPFGTTVPNPATQPGLEFTFEQPLLQGAGLFINQVRDTFPQPLRAPVPSQAVPPPGTAPGILIARLGHDEARLEFDRRVQEVLLAVEEAYWDLLAAYWDLYSRDTGLKQAQLAWQVAKQRYDNNFIPVDDLAQIEEQFHFFRTQRLESLGRGTAGRPGVLEAERRLRYVVGLPPEDGYRLIPTDVPVTQPVEPNWEEAVQTARQRRPELQQVQKEIEVARLALARAEDYLRPDLRFFSKYAVNTLDATTPQGRNFNGDVFSSWETGIQLDVPIGFRAGHAEATRARLQLAQRYAFLRDQEAKLLFSLQRSYRDVVQFREEMVTRRSQREAAAVQLRARYARFKAKGEVSSDLLVRTQRSWADALRDEYLAVCRYNIVLADFERQKGTILDYCNVKLVEGDVPAYAVSCASKNIRTWTEARLGLPVVPDLPGDAGEQLTAPGQLDAGAEQLRKYLQPGR